MRKTFILLTTLSFTSGLFAECTHKSADYLIKALFGIQKNNELEHEGIMDQETMNQILFTCVSGCHVQNVNENPSCNQKYAEILAPEILKLRQHYVKDGLEMDERKLQLALIGKKIKSHMGGYDTCEQKNDLNQEFTRKVDFNGKSYSICRLELSCPKGTELEGNILGQLTEINLDCLHNGISCKDVSRIECAKDKNFSAFIKQQEVKVLN